MNEPIRMVVWTNSKAIRKYTGQDRLTWGTRHTVEKGWRKMIAELREVPE